MLSISSAMSLPQAKFCHQVSFELTSGTFSLNSNIFVSLRQLEFFCFHTLSIASAFEYNLFGAVISKSLSVSRVSFISPHHVMVLRGR